MNYILRQPSARGALSRAAETLNCQTSYLSRVIDSKVHLTPDHAFVLCNHLKLVAAEREYFITLVEYERASDRAYREFLSGKLRELLRNHESIARRMDRPAPKMLHNQEITYFSSWQWTALHFLTACPNFQSAEAIAQRLGIGLAATEFYLERLAQSGHVRKSGNKWIYEGGAFHLGKDSPLVIQHHQNWRTRAVLNAQFPENKGLHYTNVQTVAKSDLPLLLELMLEFVDKCKSVLDSSPEEDIVAITCDVFPV